MRRGTRLPHTHSSMDTMECHVVHHEVVLQTLKYDKNAHSIRRLVRRCALWKRREIHDEWCLASSYDADAYS